MGSLGKRLKNLGAGFGVKVVATVKQILGEYFYDFSEQNTDAFTGGNNEYRLENSSPNKPDFVFDKALKFHGTNDYVSLTPIIHGDIDHSYSMWIKHDEEVTGFDIAYLRASSSLSQYIGTVNNTVIRYRVGTIADFTVPAFVIGEWFHVVITYKSGVGTRLYFNGVESSTGLIAGSQLFRLDNIGRYANSIYGAKTMDEIAVWDTTLTATDAANLYDSGNGDLATNYSPANLIAYWRLNGESGDSIAIDEQGNYNGILNNFDTDNCWIRHGYYKELSPFTGVVADFDNTNLIEPSDSSAFNFEASFSIFFVFSIKEFSGNNWLITKWDNATQKSIRIRVSDSGELSILFSNDGSTNDGSVAWADTLEIDTNYFCGISYNTISNEVSLTLNCNPFQTDTVSGSVFGGTEPLYIGSLGGSGGLKGTMSNVGFIEEALSLTQFTQIMVRPELTKNYLVDTVGITWSNVAAFYPLTEGGGDIAYDLSDNKNHGTITNPGWVKGLSTGRQLGLQNVSRYTKYDGINGTSTFKPIQFTTGVVSLWFKTNKSTGNSFILGSDGVGVAEGDTYIATRVDTNQVTTRVDASFPNFNFSSISVDTWYHLMVVYDATNVNAFLDGVASTDNPQAIGGLVEFDRIAQLWSGIAYTEIMVRDVAIYDGISADVNDALAIFNGTNVIEQLGMPNRYYTGYTNPVTGIMIDEGTDGENATTTGGYDSFTIPEVETIDNVPYDTFGLECNSKNIIVTDGEVEEVFALRNNEGVVRYDGHAGSFTNIKQIQLWLNPLDNTDIEYLLTDEANNPILYTEGNQIKSYFDLSGIMINDLETDVILNNVYVLVTIEFLNALTFEEIVIGSDYAGTPGTFSAFKFDKLNIFKEET